MAKIDRRYLFLLSLIIVLGIWTVSDMLDKKAAPCPNLSCPSCPQTAADQPVDESVGGPPPLGPTHPTTFQFKGDVIRDYDRDKVIDILEEPTRRVPRHEIPNHFFRRGIDYPTRGYPDNYSQQGILVSVKGKDGGKDGFL